MSFLNPFYNHPFIAGCVLFSAGFSTGLAAYQYVSEPLQKAESLESGRLSNDVSTLHQQVLSKDERIQLLDSELASTRDELLRQRNVSGSGNVSFQALNEKYNSLSQNYNQLSGMYGDLKSSYGRAQKNCNALNRIDFLEQNRRSLENQLSSITHDVFEKDPLGKKRDIQLLLAQNHEQLLALQRHLSR